MRPHARRSRIVVLAAAFLASAVLAAAAAPPARAGLSEKEWTAAKQALEQAFAAGDSGRICEAIKTVGLDDSRRAVDLLLAVGVSDRLDDLAIYEAVRQSLASMISPEARAHILITLERKDEPRYWARRCVICDALAVAPWKDATAALCKRLGDRVLYVVSAAAKALAHRKDPAAVPSLIERLADLEKAKDVAWIDVRQAHIIAFSDQIKAWRPSRQGLQPATSGNKADAIAWIASLQANGATHTDDALKEALANLDVNTIVLLRRRAHACSRRRHGAADRPAQDPREFLEELATANGGKLTKV